MRKVIQIENGVFLCNDGTMWERLKFEGGWMQIKPIPQPEPQEPVYYSEGGVCYCTVDPPAPGEPFAKGSPSHSEKDKG